MKSGHSGKGLPAITVIGLKGFPLVKKGDDIAKLILSTLKRNGLKLSDGDVLVVTQKIVSKAEGRLVRLSGVKPSELAKKIAEASGKDPRVVEVVLRESKRIVRMTDEHIIAETKHGIICANAGVDQSNIGVNGWVSLLPEDPDASARRIRKRLKELAGVNVGVLITDTFGRPWRLGQVNFAVGLAGMRPFVDYRGRRDMFKYRLRVTMMAIADELASAAELVMGKTKGIPVALIRGYDYPRGRGSARQLIRPAEEDLFR